MNTTTYTRNDETFIVEELSMREFLDNAVDFFSSTDGLLAFDGTMYIEYEDGSVCYYSDSIQSGDLLMSGIACGVITNESTQQVFGDYIVDGYGIVQPYDARLSLEAYAEACADTQAELDLVLADIADDFAGKQTYAEAFASAVQDEMADGYGHMVLHDAAEGVIGNVIARAKENQKIALLDGLAEVIVNNSGIECDEDDAPVFPDVASVSVGSEGISVTMCDGSVYDITVS